MPEKQFDLDALIVFEKDQDVWFRNLELSWHFGELSRGGAGHP